MVNARSFSDQLKRQISISFPPRRIISLVPSQTEFLFDIGLEEQIAGITKFCIHPQEKVRSKIKVGGTKNLNLEKIRSLQPDLIIGNKEENDAQQIKALMDEFPVWMSDITTLDDAYAMMESIGNITGKEPETGILLTRIKSAIRWWQASENKFSDSCCYLIWKDPLLTVGHDTFIHHLLGLAGFKNSFSDLERYPEITEEDLKQRSPQVLLLSSEPFPFSTKHFAEFKIFLPQTKIILADGEMFSWYGSRLQLLPGYLLKLWESIK